MDPEMPEQGLIFWPVGNGDSTTDVTLPTAVIGLPPVRTCTKSGKTYAKRQSPVLAQFAQFGNRGGVGQLRRPDDGAGIRSGGVDKTPGLGTEIKVRMSHVQWPTDVSQGRIFVP